MKVAELLESRRRNWQQLEGMIDRLQNRRRSRCTAAELAEFAELYRAACADLALADSYQLPPNTVQYLHRLVGRAHNQLYRSRKFDFAAWG
ncbi:MAG: stage II sporulation protein M, partial [Planctomycetes bacterium]|nr:stage II sporulation protein M [Planctomycetota bacterium]